MRSAAHFLLVLLLSTTTAWAAPAGARVSFELLTKPGLPLTASQEWYKALSDLGVSGLQIHSAKPGDEMSVKTSGGKASKEFKVVGILSADNVLYLPGGKFKLSDKGRLRTWLDNLGDQGAEGVTEPRKAFGLFKRQLETVVDDLKSPVGFTTKGMSAAKAINQIGSGLKFSLELDEAGRKQLVGVKLEDEMKDVARGTALAAMLRPAGLAFEPAREAGGEIHYKVRKAQAGREAWPIGWKTKGERSKALPLLFEHLKVDITETPVAEAAESIQGRLEVPFLYDRNAMALHDVDPTKVQASASSNRLTYSQILGKIFLQAKLKFDLRVDDNDKPFLWITTIKPVKE